MADKNVNQIVVQLIDKLTAPARNVERSMKGIQQAAKSGQLDLVGFNRALFATTAFVGTVQRAFSGMFSVITKGAELGRLTDQFERVLGPQGHFFGLISQFTDTAVDRVEALRSGIELANLGISKNAEVTAAMIAKASVAAKRGGFDAATGIKEYTAFLKDGSIAHLENIGLINRANMSYMVQQKILESSGGTMGGVIALQARYSIGQMLLNQRTSGLMHGHRDLVDVLQRLGNMFVDLRRNMGQFLGTALIPIIDKISSGIQRFSIFLEHIIKNHKGVLGLAKSFIVATGAMALFLTSAVVIKNVLAGIASLGFGIGGFFRIFLGLALADNIGNLTNLLANLSKFVQDVAHQLITWLSPIGKLIAGISNIVKSTYEWVTGTKLFVQNGRTVYDVIVKITAATIALVGAFKVLALIKSVLTFGLLTREFVTLNAAMAAARGEAGVLGLASGLARTAPGAAGMVGTGLAGTMKFSKGLPILSGILGAAQFASTTMDKKSSTRDMIASAVGDIAIPLISTIAGSFFGPVGGMVGFAAGQGLGTLAKIWISQTDRTVDAINGVTDELSGDQTDNVLPQMPDTQLELISKIADMMGGIRGEQRNVFSEAFRAAVLPLGEGGKDITAEEYVKLQKIANGFLKDIRDQKVSAYSGPRKFKGVDIWAFH